MKWVSVKSRLPGIGYYPVMFPDKSIGFVAYFRSGQWRYETDTLMTPPLPTHWLELSQPSNVVEMEEKPTARQIAEKAVEGGFPTYTDLIDRIEKAILEYKP